jgi:hypothetical protein
MADPLEHQQLRRELDGIYWSIEDAKEEIWKRWNSVELRKKVESYLRGDIPSALLKEGPRAVISRHVMSPNFELLNFLDTTRKKGLAPVGFEYLEDKFVTKNEDKYYLGKMFFYQGLGKNGGEKTSSIKVVDFDFIDGKKISEIQTTTGKSFIEFHHSLLTKVLDAHSRVDMSEYYKRHGGQAKLYYRYILSLFVCHGVLFENFLLNGFYKDLTEHVLLPTYKEIFQLFGVKPIIVRLVPENSEEDIHWRHYPEEYQESVSAIMDGMGQSGHINT